MMGALWACAALLPLLTAAVLLGVHRSGAGAPARVAGAALVLSPLSLLPAGMLAVLGPEQELTVPWLLLGTTVGLDVVSRSLLLVTVLLYSAACLAVTRKDDERAPELVAYLLVCFVGNAGTYVAGDAMTFYACFSLMSLAAAGLVIHDRTDGARRATRIYLVLAMASEMAVLAALVMVARAGGMQLAEAPMAVARSPHTELIVVLALVGFGIKAGLAGLHMWLPLAHPAAPPAASAVLSGAMVKAGLVGMVRFLPLGHVSLETIGLLVVALCLAGSLLAVPVGALQRDPKAVLAYSTISQMGFLGVLVGAALAAPQLAAACVTSAVIYAVHHGLAKGALFLGVPMWKHHGNGRARFAVVAGLAVAGLAVVGAPLSSGAIGKYAAKNAIEGTELLGVDATAVLPFVATGSTLLLLRLAWTLRGSEVQPRVATHDPELMAGLGLCALSAMVPWVLTQRWVPLSDVPGLDPVTVWDAAWPVLLGLAIGVPAWLLLPRYASGLTRRASAAVPPGDVIVPLERVAARAGAVLRRVSDRVNDASRAIVNGTYDGIGAALRAETVRQRAEDGLGRWDRTGTAVLIILVALIAAAALGG